MNRSDAHLVFVNGNILGCHSSPHYFAAQCRHLRRVGLLGEFVSVYVHDGLKEVHLSCDSGRPCRPLIIVDPHTMQPRVTVRAGCASIIRVVVCASASHLHHVPVMMLCRLNT